MSLHMAVEDHVLFFVLSAPLLNCNSHIACTDRTTSPGLLMQFLLHVLALQATSHALAIQIVPHALLL